MKYFPLFLLLILCACKNDDKAPDAAVTQKPEMKLPAPKKVQIRSGKATFVEDETPEANVEDDLNGDGERDRLDVITTKEENDGLGFKRQLVVYSGEGADLDAWYTAGEVILSTRHGGMMGDPLESVKIENGTIVVRHFGGSRAKWHNTHRFRWQDGDFKLIGATIINDDACTEYTELDYNLSTGEAEYSVTPQDCTGDEIKKGVKLITTFRKKMPLPSMDGFVSGTYELSAPELNKAVYF
ncbi:hypothetical protein FUA23_10745 [Neolewinella aurantiaca]|uniref:Lipoprotein n=1 Tax=Neolewinella aurantiaca TaxID=2602767 RepID=A0A5C7FI58_9BACT|nr:hypothetical protein [Neolewinella aurantiaca]TXF89436.1 hypothetical protein FUA23_10745 [Neolewinella aurantiaca]